MNWAVSRATNPGLTCAFGRELSPSVNRALSLRLNLALSAGANAAVPVRVLCPAVPYARDSCEQRGIGKAAALPPCFKAQTVIYT